MQPLKVEQALGDPDWVMAIGDIRPQEVHATKVEAPQVAAVPNSADNSDAEVQHTPAANQQGGSAAPKGDSAVPPT